MNGYRSHSSGGGRTITLALPDLRGTITVWIIGVCVVVYVSQMLLSQFGAVPLDVSYSLLGLSKTGLARGYVWQLVTTPFVHFSVSHLAFNMIALAFLGAGIERRLGRKQYIAFSVWCALAGSLGFLMFSSPRNLCGGYSGVLYGVMAATAVLYPDTVVQMFWVFPMKMKWAMVVLGLVALFSSMEPNRDGVADSAHLLGAIAGYVYIKFWGRTRMRMRVPTLPRLRALVPKRKEPKSRIPKKL